MVTTVRRLDFERDVQFIFFGSLGASVNAILVIALLRARLIPRRKEFIVITALAFADFVDAFSTFLSGIYRLTLLLSHHTHLQVSSLMCQLLPWSWMWRWSDASTATMLLVVAIDRLIAVMRPLLYFRLPVSFPYTLVVTAYLYSFITSLFSWISPIEERNQRFMSVVCLTKDFTSSRFYQFSKYTTSVYSLLSVIIFAPLVVSMRRQLHAIGHRVSSDSQMDRKRRAQLRITATLALSSISTLLFDSIPRAVGVYMLYHEAQSMASNRASSLHSPPTPTYRAESHFYLIFFNLSKLNSAINLLLYCKRHEHVRRAVWDLFSARKSDSGGGNQKAILSSTSRRAAIMTNGNCTTNHSNSVMMINSCKNKNNQNHDDFLSSDINNPKQMDGSYSAECDAFL